MKNKIITLFNKTGMALGFAAILGFVVSCGNDYTPKPRGYIRFDLPEKQYRQFDSAYPYTFEYPVYAQVKPYKGNEEPYWLNILFPKYQATIHLSYKQLDNNLGEVLEDIYTLVYKHTIKADAITEQPFVNPDEKVYGFLYDLEGNAASSVQFYVTDSTRNFIRGSLYFYSQPNRDSLAPLIDFFRADIQHMMETMRWRNIK